jgi:hypothetical protein
LIYLLANSTTKSEHSTKVKLQTPHKLQRTNVHNEQTNINNEHTNIHDNNNEQEEKEITASKSETSANLSNTEDYQQMFSREVDISTSSVIPGRIGFVSFDR